MKARYADGDSGPSKSGLYTALLSTIFFSCSVLQSLLAAVLPPIHLQPQLFSRANSVARVVVRHSRGVSGINLTCALLGCQVVQAIGDPDGQLFVVQSSSLLNSALFLTQLT